MRLTLLIIGMALCASAYLSSDTAAQEPKIRVSMEEAIRLFGENSLSLRIARSEAAEIAGTARQSRGYFNPVFELERESLNRDGVDYWETIVAVRQQLEWPGRTSARGRSAAHRVAAANAAYQADSLRLAFWVRRGYAEAWGTEEHEAALERVAAVISRISDAAEQRHEAGDISGYELRRLRIEQAHMDQSVAEAGLEAAASRRRLAALVLPEAETAQIGPAEPLIGKPPLIALDAALAGLSSRPDLVAAGAAFDATDADVEAATSGWVPDPVLGLGYKDQADGFDGLVFNVALPLPLFDQRGGARDAAEARRAGAGAVLGLREREARNDLLASHDSYATKRSQLSRIEDRLLEDADELLLAATTSYDEGELTLVGFLDAARAFRDARVRAVTLRAEAWIAYYDLLRAMGRAPEEDQ